MTQTRDNPATDEISGSDSDVRDDEANSVFAATLRHAFELWVDPEIERRRSAGILPEGFALFAAQIIMNVGAPIEVRLNDEIRGVLKVKASRDAQKGEAVSSDAFTDIHDIQLAHVDPNAGHMTFVLHRGVWFMQFDFRYNAGRVQENLRAAREFLDAAKFSSERQNLRAFCENLFAATELLAKGELLMIPDEKLLKSRKHEYVASNYNRWGKLGNADPRHVRLLNELSELRHEARYVGGTVTLSPDDMESMVVVAEEMFERVTARAPSRRGS